MPPSDSSSSNPTEARQVGRLASSAGWLSNLNSSSIDGMDLTVARRFVLNQRVNVNIVGNGWFIGTVVTFLTVAQSLTRSAVRVKYSIPPDPKERTADVPDDPRYIRPI